MIRSFLALAPLAALAACGQSATTEQGNAAAPKESGYIAKVKALPEGQREGVLFRAIQNGGGQGCQGVDKVESLDPTKTGNPNWRVTCPGGAQWMVTLSDDGTALVTGARDEGRPAL